MNTTTKEILRYIFGNAPHWSQVASPVPKWGMPIHPGQQRLWKAAIELTEMGIAVIVKRANGGYYVRRAADEKGRIEITPEETIIPQPERLA